MNLRIVVMQFSDIQNKVLELLDLLRFNNNGSVVVFRNCELRNEGCE